MNDPDVELQRRLDQLSQMLGQKISFVETPPDDQADTETTEDPDPLQWQRDMAPRLEEGEKSKDELEQEDDGAPQRFFGHDAGPRPHIEDAFDDSRFKIGEPIETTAEFVPWKIVKAYPYTFVGKTNRPHARSPSGTVELCFEKIFEGRVWDFFYLYHPIRPAEKPYLFVTTSQFQCFLDFVNRALGISLCIPAGQPSGRFFIRFGEGGTPRPRYFRRFSHEDLEAWLEWPDVSVQDAELFTAASGICQDDWEAKLRLITSANSSKWKKGHKKAEQNKLDRHFMLEETQTLLGAENSRPLHGIKSRDNVVLIAVDVEAIERPPHPVSEIGIAILDMKDIKGIAHGPAGQQWHSNIKAHHLRTKEVSGLINHEFIQGCPDFFNFGKSAFPTKEKLAEAVSAILNPFVEVGRDIVIVGHDVKQDVQCLASIGVNLPNTPNICRTVDTQAIHMAWKDTPSGRGLSGVMGDLGLVGTNYHNAGNDAVYTIQALIGVAVEEKRQREFKAQGKGDDYKPELWTV